MSPLYSCGVCKRFKILSKKCLNQQRSCFYKLTGKWKKLQFSKLNNGFEGKPPKFDEKLPQKMFCNKVKI